VGKGLHGGEGLGGEIARGMVVVVGGEAVGLECDGFGKSDYLFESVADYCHVINFVYKCHTSISLLQRYTFLWRTAGALRFGIAGV
jgi:hypothetical protein